MNCQKIFIIIWFINKVRRLLCKDNVFHSVNTSSVWLLFCWELLWFLVLDRLGRMSRRQLVRQGKACRLPLWYQQLSLLLKQLHLRVSRQVQLLWRKHQLLLNRLLQVQIRLVSLLRQRLRKQLQLL